MAAADSNRAAVSRANKFGNKFAAQKNAAKENVASAKRLNQAHFADAVNKKNQLGKDSIAFILHSFHCLPLPVVKITLFFDLLLNSPLSTM